MRLKPQDIVIALKFAVIGDTAWTYSSMSVELVMSASEVNSGVKRLLHSGLLREPIGQEVQPQVNRQALAEFLGHGLRYAFPIISSGMVRGMPTSYAAEPLCRDLKNTEDPIPVWPWEHGQSRGFALEPLYRTVPEAAAKDDVLYRALVVADGLREPSPRVRAVAEGHMRNLLGVHDEPK